MSDITVNYPVTPQPELSLDAQPMAQSLSVTIASDQTPIPVTATFSDPSIGTNGDPAPTSSGLTGAVDTDTGDLQPINTHAVLGKNLLFVDGSQVTQPISASSLPLPIDAASETSLSGLNTKIPSGLTVTSTRLLVDGSGVTQPISAASLPLPSGAATSTIQTDGSQKTQIVNSSGTVTTSTAIGSKQSLDISVTSDPSLDVFATNVTGTRYNQIEINFETAPGASLITNTTSGGASITQANGHSLYSTGTATSAEAKSVSVYTVKYRPAHEIYGYFTASFTNPTSANSYQRIGIYDTNNGFFIGFNGLNFGITSRTATVDTFVNRSAFNGDLLNGSAGSNFTRNGIPEAINLVYSNVFRIRFGWLGSASILFDVFSPDGIWVTFHSIKQPNSSLNPSITNPDLPMTIDVYKSGSDATNLVMSTACWAGGTTSGYSKITDTLNDNTLASITRSVITGVTTGGGGGYVNVKVNPSGALVADVTGTVTVTGVATSTKQSDGSQKTQIVDGSGNVIASTSNALNVNIQNTSIQTKAAVNLNGSGSGAAATVSTVITLTAPSNAVGFILMNMDTSTANIRYAIGRTASATLGQQLQPGRDTGFIPCGANISLCAESGTQTYDVQWVSQ